MHAFVAFLAEAVCCASRKRVSRNSKMERVPGRVARAPQPVHRLYLLLLYENMDDRSWRADVLSLTLWGVLAPTRSGSYILPFRQPEERRPLMTVHRETLRVFEGISEEVSSRRRELQRRFAAQ